MRWCGFPLRVDLSALPEKIFSPFSFSCQKSFFCFSKIISPLLWISLKKICFCPLWKKSALCLDLSFKKKEKSLACSLWPLFIWQHLPSIGYSISLFNAHGYGKCIHGGSLGDSLEDVAVSYLVSVQILVTASSAVDWSDRVELDFLRLP